jgi:hypothetical protein
MPKVVIKDMHRTIGDLSKPPANIPTGVWKLRAIKISTKDVTKTNREGEEYETQEYTLSMEPISPTQSVNPKEVAELDERTGKPVYEGKRLFLRFVEAFRSDMGKLGVAVQAMGFLPDDDFDAIVEGNKVRGKVVFGEIYNRPFKRNDGSDGIEQLVRAWAASEGSQAFVL